MYMVLECDVAEICRKKKENHDLESVDFIYPLDSQRILELKTLITLLISQNTKKIKTSLLERVF